MTLSIAFRTDASLDIGTGHVMRCLTLADAVREHGAICRFICRAHPGNLIELIRQRGYEVISLACATEASTKSAAGGTSSPVHAHWLGTDWETDAHDTLAALSDVPVDWLIVDHYALDAQWERSLRPVCRRLMVIDDLADRPHDCDLLLDQNLGQSTADYTILVPDGCTVLTGPQYALLRPEFAALRPYSLARRESPQLKHLLITMGGVDKDNVTGKVLNALRECSLPMDCKITVVMGAHAPWIDHVRQQAVEMLWPTEVLTNVQNMAELMAESDLAIGAAGSTAWERCALGLPSLLLILASNQEKSCHYLQKRGATISLGNSQAMLNILKNTIQEFAGRPQLLTTYIRYSAGICDGRGVERVVTTLGII